MSNPYKLVKTVIHRAISIKTYHPDFRHSDYSYNIIRTEIRNHRRPATLALPDFLIFLVTLNLRDGTSVREDRS